MTYRLFIPAALLLAQCASAPGAITVVTRGSVPALSARTDAGIAPLEAELVRFAVPLAAGGIRPADFLVARDPRNGLTLFRLIVIGDRPFEEARQVMHRRLEQLRPAEHDGRIYRFGLGIGVEIDEFTETYPSLRAAEKEAETWIARHPEMMDMNSILVSQRYVEYPPLGGSFYNDPTTSQPKETLLRDARREGDHWLVTIEGPSHQLATLAINDRDQVVDVRLETRQVPQ